jgi:hypothetical protein
VLLEIALTKSDVECEHAVSAEEVEAFARSLNARYSRGRRRGRAGGRERMCLCVCAGGVGGCGGGMVVDGLIAQTVMVMVGM